jgi:4-alpha-glucanotransferase
LGDLPFIAEDLGLITPDVGALRDQFKLPGMRVLQFAFDGNWSNPHLPHNFAANTVVYTGTHDNATTRSYLPGYAEDNWRWRATEDMLTPETFRWLHDLTQTWNRAS